MQQQHKNIIFITIGLILISMAAKAAPKTKAKAFLAFSPNTRVKLLPVYDLLINAGLQDPQLSFATSQVLFETGEFSKKSKVADLNNNLSGIMFINKPGIQKNAVKGSAFPSKEGKYYYAKFKTLQDWANDYVRVLNLKNKPLQAVTVKDYVTRLAKNKYFVPNTGSAFTNYYNGVKKYHDLLTV